MTATKTVRTLPADVYDALELSAEAFGGIGAGDFIDDNCCPLCIMGLAGWATNEIAHRGQSTELGQALVGIGIDTVENDFAVRNITVNRPRHSRYARVPFADWCAELGVVRGAA